MIQEKMVTIRFQLIGDVAVLCLPQALDGQKEEIARSLVSRNKSIRTVLNKTSKLEGERRVATFEVLAGGETLTLHREYGFTYRLDVANVFFNSRLGYERQRIAALVDAGERVLVPFCGVGPFAVPIAAKGAKVVALEKSREACRWLEENARRNKVKDNLMVVNSDALRTAKMLKPCFDRAVIPAPYGMDEILPVVCEVVRMGGWVHFYTFKKRNQIEGLKEEYRQLGFDVELCRRCGNVAPGVSRWAFDMVKVSGRDDSKHNQEADYGVRPGMLF
jgi:tRNA (guanine37-N1)-methyltransferase